MSSPGAARRLLIERLESRAMLATVSTLGAEFQVNTYTAGNQEAASVATDSSGDVVAVAEQRARWQRLRHLCPAYNSAGTELGSEFRVNTYTTGAQELPSVAMDSAGDFVIAWQS